MNSEQDACPTCGNAKTKEARTCLACFKANPRKERIKVNCGRCGREMSITAKRREQRRGRYCSRECSFDARRGGSSETARNARKASLLAAADLTQPTQSIPLTGGACALIDTCDLELVAGFAWRAQSASTKSSGGYATAVSRENGRREQIFMHRLIVGAGPDEHVDHKNRNRLDNRRENLRCCPKGANAQNVGPTSRSRTGVRGVYLSGPGHYVAQIYHGGKTHHLGSFSSIEEARKVAVAARKQQMPYFVEDAA